MLRSKPARSRPDFRTGAAGGAAAAGAAAGFGTEAAQAARAAVSAAVAAVTRKRFILTPVRIREGPSIKKAPGFVGSGLEKADFR
jgi:hypothetical protein